MNTLPFQPEIAKRMLINTENESIHPDAQFFQTANGYWLAWHNGLAAVLAPNTPPDIPCFWVEGAQNIQELAALAESGALEQAEEFDADDDAWLEACCTNHEHGGHCGC